MGDPGLNIKTRHSFCTPQEPKQNITPTINDFSKSDINVLQRKRSNMTANKKREHIAHYVNSHLAEYYKNYDHDELPVKDLTRHTNIGDKKSLTNSELDKLEKKIFANMSQELQVDNNSVTSLESNIKFFKTTVQEIFDNFNASMRDFELYKKRFQDILAKSHIEAVADMEDFIKDMIHHIMSSETSMSNESRRSTESKTDSIKKSDDYLSIDVKDEETCEHNPAETVTLTTASTVSVGGSVQPIMEAYKNREYVTDSNEDDNKTKSSTKEEVLNIYLLSGTPCVQIKMNERNLLSEINIKEPSCVEESKYVASAENVRKLTAKKMELEKYVEQERDVDDGPDRDIPVKVSYAKKNIHLNEDFTQEHECEKSFIAKICNFLCRKFRKS